MENVVIIGIYVPNEDAPIAEKDMFQDTLDEVLSKIGDQREVILMSDMNARTGETETDEIVGKFGEKAMAKN